MENHRFVEELNNRLFRAGCSLWIYHINSDLYWDDTTPRPDASVFELIDYTRTDAVVIMDERIKSKPITGKIIRTAKQNGIPVVVVDAEYPDCASVRFDYSTGFEKVCRHVIEEHHVRKPHFMGGIQGNPFSEERLSIFRKVLADNGIPFTDSMVSYGLFWAKPTIEETQKLLARGEPFDAVICANDIMAINVSTVLQQNGLRVPEDVIVTGFDGIDEACFSSPPITTARCSGAEMAVTVFDAVTACLADVGHTGKYAVVPTMLPNISCGCSSTEDNKKLYSFNDRFYRYQDDTLVFYAISERMQNSPGVDELSWCMYADQIQDISVVINKWCTDQTVNHFEGEQHSGFDEEMFLLFDTDERPFRAHDFRRSDIIPGLEQAVEQGYPLIFNALSFMGLPLGYVCFHFRGLELTNYCQISEVVNALNSGIGGFMNRQYQRYLVEQVEFMYKYDALTGLYNRLSFANEFSRLKEQLAGRPVPLTMLLSDLDGLKTINDNYGHSAGDNAIRVVAQTLKQSCPESALCVRFGGDEMLAVITGECDPEAVIAEIHDRLARYNAQSGLAYTVSASAGYHTGVLDAETDFERLIRETDEAMYAEKQRKKQED